jgi:hypothetical protein
VKKNDSGSQSDHGKHLHLDHLFKVGVLLDRSQNKKLSQATRMEAAQELLRYRDEGIIIQTSKEVSKVAKKSTRAHEEPDPVFGGRGIIFAVIDDREEMREGRVTTIDVLTEGIESALDAGHETSEDIARYLTTSAFQHITDKRVRFNSVLKAGDIVGAQIVRKLHNAYNDLAVTAEEEEDPKQKALLRSEATGFAEALMVVLSPFSSEDQEDPRLVSWEEIDRMTATFEKEQRFVIKERKGTPQ